MVALAQRHGGRLVGVVDDENLGEVFVPGGERFELALQEVVSPVSEDQETDVTVW